MLRKTFAERRAKLTTAMLVAFLVAAQLSLADPCALANPADAPSSAAASYRAYLADDADIFTDACQGTGVWHIRVRGRGFGTLGCSLGFV